MDMVILVVSTLNQLFVRGSFTAINFENIKVVSEKTSFFLIVPFCASHYALAGQFCMGMLRFHS